MNSPPRHGQESRCGTRHTGRLGAWLLLLWLLAPALPADVPAGQRQEVEHLLNFIAGSGCELERNGRYYPPAEALRHIRRKYDHFRDDIETSEDFIAHAATRSLLSGRDYHVRCPGQAPVKLADWLRQELRRYRRSRSGH